MFTYSSSTKAKPKSPNELPTQHMHTYQGEVIRKSINASNPVVKVPFLIFRKTKSIARLIPKLTSQKLLILMVGA